MRIKFVKDYKDYRAGMTREVSPNVAFGLIDTGKAILTKDITPDDYKQAGDERAKTRQNTGKTRKH